MLLGWLGAPAPALADGVVIDHTALGCVVAGRFPRLNACLSPRSQVARARIYFHAEGTPDWYFVEMKSDAPCFAGVLPRPKPTMQRFRYYVAVTDRSFRESQTPEYAADVVPNGASCRKGPLAPFVDKAAVVVGSASGAAAVPAGFFGAGIAGAGVSTGLIAGSVAVVGGGVAAGVGLAGGGSGEGGRPPTTAPPPTAATATTLPATSTTTVPAVVTTTTLAGTPTTTVPSTTTTTTTTTSTTTSTTMPGCPPPQVEITSPVDGLVVDVPVVIVAAASDPGGSGVTEVRFYYQDVGSVSPRILIGAVPKPPYSWSWNPPCTRDDTFRLTADAVNACGNVATSKHVQIKVRRPPGSCPSPSAAALLTTLSWTSELGVPGGRGQVVLNGVEASFPGFGRSRASGAAVRALNRIEATLVDGAGRPGAWRFDLDGIVPGSLRVVAGPVALVTADSVVFRLSGRPGERVVFSFRSLGER